MRIVAVVAVRNGEVHIARCLSDLINSGIDVILLDNESIDNTVGLARRFLGKGLLSVERLAWTGAFDLSAQLEKKRQIMSELPCDWLMHVDVDEWLSPPTPGISLREAITRVDSLGFDTINFEEMTYVAWPDENFNRPDYAEQMRTYYFFEPSKLRLMRAWKKRDAVTNVTHAGHRLEGVTSLFPQNFILRHYIALSADYVFNKYASRTFDQAEVARGWHHSKDHQRIGITRDMCDLRPSQYLRTLPSTSSLEFDRSCPAPKHFWQWPKIETRQGV